MGKQIIKTILAIDTSCDETSAAVTSGTKILSNIVWSQASLHAKFGGVMPSLARRQHEERIDFVINKAIRQAKHTIKNIDAIAVTAGPGLAIALEVGIKKAQALAHDNRLPLIPVNHIEGHLFSALVEKSSRSEILTPKISFPAIGLIASGGNTQCILVNKIGEYEILAQTRDDALGEALDKGARMLNLGYPGAPVLEKMAEKGNPQHFSLPLPLVGQKVNYYSYSGLKTAMYRLVQKLESQNQIDRQAVYDLSATFQNIAFKHFLKISFDQINKHPVKHLFCGGGVMANNELRRQIRKLSREHGLISHFPYNKKLCTDNAGMIGIVAFLRGDFQNYPHFERLPKWPIGT